MTGLSSKLRAGGYPYCGQYARQSCQNRAFLQIVPIEPIVNSISYVFSARTGRTNPSSSVRLRVSP
jgi:hypothetical protein